MKRLIPVVVIMMTLTSCGTSTLYYWGGVSNGTTRYEDLAYKHYDKQSPESLCKLICLYEDMVSHPVGTRQVPPPGICAEYAYLISQPETVTTFVENATVLQKSRFGTDDFPSFFSQRMKELFEMELTLYPESAPFIKPLFDKIVNR